jgi:ribonuclease HI
MADERPKDVIIFTDGGALGNPGPGGYGVVLLYGGHRKELSGGFRLTTNNRMELMAAIVGLSALKARCRVQVFSDSKYLVDAMSQGWAENWRGRNWRRKGRGAALNPDLWERLLDLCRQHNVTFSWVRGHNGEKENERCDKLAVEAARPSDLPPDEKFEISKGLTKEEPNTASEE